MAYWKSVSDATNNNWEPPKNENLIIRGYPFWLMLWGWEDHTRKLSEIRDLDNNYVLVLRSKYFSESYPAYVLLNESFVNGRAPYNNRPRRHKYYRSKKLVYQNGNFKKKQLTIF